MADNWTSSAARDPQVITNENVVIVVLPLVGEARKTGERIEMPLVHVLKVRNGPLLEFRPFYWDTAATSAALGHDPVSKG